MKYFSGTAPMMQYADDHDMIQNRSVSYETLRSSFHLLENEPMSRHTSFRVGGPADLFASPESVDVLVNLVRTARMLSVPVTVLGGGTNILVRDRGIRGLVISTAGLTETVTILPMDQDRARVTALAGMPLVSLARFIMDNGYNGFGFAAGIPGTVGGAVVMNAGTGEGTISDSLVSLEILGDRGILEILDRSDLVVCHRSLAIRGRSLVQDRFPILVRTVFEVEKGNPEAIREAWDVLLEKRRNTQPRGLASAGCFFKNPESGNPAGQLIDRAGLKGRRVGNAMVSDVHANFIVNLGGATAADILSLKAIVEASVMEQFGVTLVAEVRIEGE
ncbi:MAG: UDP-N-acetylmuramate dehydrogenase [Pseudomonadota bacterium]